jgi:rRNA maturation protein Nop10
MNYKCDKCEAEFEPTMVIQCPKCGEAVDLSPIYQYKKIL